LDDEQLAGHLQVDRQEGIAREMDDDLLGPPRDTLDPPSGDALGERFGRDPAEGPRPQGRRVDDRRARDQRSEVGDDWESMTPLTRVDAILAEADEAPVDAVAEPA
jgi:hypothetical protein